MAALVSESWVADRELGIGAEPGQYGRRQPNRQPRVTRPVRIPPRPTEPWPVGQNTTATAGLGNNNNNHRPPNNANNIRNKRNINNVSQATSNSNLQQNAASSTQPQPQGRNRNRNRNRNSNRAQDAQTTTAAGPSPQPRRNNRGGRRGNQPNTEASNNLTTDPITGEVISKRAAKRRRAKARKAAAREATGGQTSVQQQPRIQSQSQSQPLSSSSSSSSSVQPSVSTHRTAASDNTQALNTVRPSTNALPAPSIPSVSLANRTPFRPTPQPQRTGTSAIRPIVTTSTTVSSQAAQTTSLLPANHESSGRASLTEDNLDRWRRFLETDAPQTVRPTNSAVRSNSNPLSRPTPSFSHVRQAPAAPSAPLASQNLPGSSLQPGRVGTAGGPSISRTVPLANNRPNPVRMRSTWDSDDDDEFSGMPQLIRAVREPVVPVRAPPVLNATRRVPASASARPNPPRPRATTACLICLDIPDEFPLHRPTTRCTHPITICAPCLEQHISHAVLSQGSTTLTCPDPSCRQAMEYADVIRSTKGAKACQDRYEALLLRRTLEAEPNFVWCKNAKCNWGQVHESGANAPIVICQVCRARSCFTHNVPWHTGLTCTQYNAQHVNRARENQASEAYIARNAKQCPNPRCGRRIEKFDGCDHMTCRLPVGCGHEFCWICLADYRTILREGNHRHNPTCQYYAAIQRVPAFEDYLRQQRYGAPLNPPPRPELRTPIRVEPAILPRPMPQPAPPAQQTRTEENSGSVWGWLLGAAVAGWMLRR